MKLTIVAATGGVGRELLEQAVAAGHDVTAVARNPAKLSRQVPSVTADLSRPDPAVLESAAVGADAFHHTYLSGCGETPGARTLILPRLHTGGVKTVLSLINRPCLSESGPLRSVSQYCWPKGRSGSL